LYHKIIVFRGKKMSYFQWLGSLVDELIDWLGDIFASFVEELISIVQRIWDTIVSTALIAAYGFVVGLYVIFYSIGVIGETLMEIWNPNANVYNQRPQVFTIQQAEQKQLPPRENAQHYVIKG
jgi:hypothetical protein